MVVLALVLLGGASACTAAPDGGGGSAAPTSVATPSSSSTGAATPSSSPTGSAPPLPSPSAVPTTPPPAPAGPVETPPPAPVPAPSTLPARLLATDWDRVPTDLPVIALTFDAGSSDAAVGSILATLDAYDVTATFFATGDFARTYPAQVAAVVQAGHRLGNHSDSHEHYPALTDAEIRDDLAAAEAALVAAAGPVPVRPWFRFPFGDRTGADVVAVNSAQYVPVRWTVDTLGWKGTSGGITADLVVERVLAAAEPGAIVLMHVGANPQDGTTLDADALPRIIEGLRTAGYGFVTLDALL